LTDQTKKPRLLSKSFTTETKGVCATTSNGRSQKTPGWSAARTGGRNLVSKLNPQDFRAHRLVLDPCDFALGDDEPDQEPTDLISQDVWEHITTLPGDVAIRTSSHQSTRIAHLYELQLGWLQSMPATGALSGAMLEASDNFDAATFNLLHGYYRQAIGGLRDAVEVVTLGCVCEIDADTEAWAHWETGDAAKFKIVCDRLQRLPTVEALEKEARSRASTSLYAGDDGNGRNAWARSLYQRLSSFSHSRGDTTNAHLWESNGPVYSAAGLRQSYHAFLET
jgi:hypothetical protein